MFVGMCFRSGPAKRTAPAAESGGEIFILWCNHTRTVPVADLFHYRPFPNSNSILYIAPTFFHLLTQEPPTNTQNNIKSLLHPRFFTTWLSFCIIFSKKL